MQRTDMKDVKSVIFSCEGLVLTAQEKEFFASEKPLGFILFARNIDNPEQVRALVNALRASVGRADAPVLLDQEGGRVQRLRSPHWFEAPAFGLLGQLYDLDAAKGIEACRLATALICDDLNGVGITVDCSPCLDLALPVTSSVIGDRSFHADPNIVAKLGAVVALEFIENGIIPVIKHIPGHGRGTVDSHLELPVVDAGIEELVSTDFAPFKQLGHSPWGMTAHIVFKQIDPERPATQSAKVVTDIIRNQIGFDGLLLTDDLNMNALDGPLEKRAERALEAGVDVVLHCSGKLDEMKSVAQACGPLQDASLKRYHAAQSMIQPPPQDTFSSSQMKARLDHLLELVN